MTDNSRNNKFTPPELRVTEPNGTCHQRKVQYRPLYSYDGTVTEMCILAGTEPKYMRDQPDFWLFASLEECCQDHFWWAMSSCTGGNQGEAEQTLLENPFYPIFSEVREPSNFVDWQCSWVGSTVTESAGFIIPFTNVHVSFSNCFTPINSADTPRVRRRWTAARLHVRQQRLVYVCDR